MQCQEQWNIPQHFLYTVGFHWHWACITIGRVKKAFFTPHLQVSMDHLIDDLLWRLKVMTEFCDAQTKALICMEVKYSSWLIGYSNPCKWKSLLKHKLQLHLRTYLIMKNVHSLYQTNEQAWWFQWHKTYLPVLTSRKQKFKTEKIRTRGY